MTDIDLDAIRARYDAANRDTAVDPFGPAWVVASYVPALLARLAEVEAERDAAVKRAELFEVARGLTDGPDGDLTVGKRGSRARRLLEIEKSYATLAAENARLRQERDAALHQRDASNLIRGNLKADLAAANDALADVTRLLDEAREERNRALASCEAMSPVASLAISWRRRTFGSILADHEAPLADAVDTYVGTALVDAYRAARPGETPGALVPGEDDITAEPDAYRAAQKAPATDPNATETDEQAEPAVTSTNTAQAQRGVQGDWTDITGLVKRGPQPERHVEILLDNSGGEPKPADPPGLDSAIEAAAKAYDRWTYGEVAARHGDGMQAAVRAAAPALRAGALREAAEKLSAEALRVHRLGGEYNIAVAVGVNAAARMMHDRADHIDADRIGGAT